MRLPVAMKMLQAHGMSNGGVDDWSKVLRGRHELFKLFCKKEGEAVTLKLDQDKAKLHKFMEDYAEDLHTLMIYD